MRYIEKPTDKIPYFEIEMQPDGSRRPVQKMLDFEGFVTHVVRKDGRFRCDFEGIESGLKILEALKEQKLHSRLALDDAHWNRLAEAVRKPTEGPAGYPIDPPFDLKPWIELTANATTTNPGVPVTASARKRLRRRR
jgi:hypothetical protein